jgi:hypothetical protein
MAQTRVRVSFSTKTLYSIVQQRQENEIIIPEHQREYCWNESRKDKFVQSVLRVFPCPAILLGEHRADKPTWLYIVGVPRAALPLMPPPAAPREAHKPKVRQLAADPDMRRRQHGTRGVVELMSKTQRHLTPREFALFLVAIAVAALLRPKNVEPNPATPEAATGQSMTSTVAAPPVDGVAPPEAAPELPAEAAKGSVEAKPAAAAGAER